MQVQTVEHADDWPGYVKRAHKGRPFEFHDLVLEIALVRLSARTGHCMYAVISARH